MMLLMQKLKTLHNLQLQVLIMQTSLLQAMEVSQECKCVPLECRTNSKIFNYKFQHRLQGDYNASNNVFSPGNVVLLPSPG